MIQRMKGGLFVAMSALLAACGAGAGASPPGPYQFEYPIESASATPPAPLAPGQSVTVSFRERTCKNALGADHQWRRVGCDAWHTPAALTVTVAMPDPDFAQPCAGTASVVGPGTILATKTGPGDPRVIGGASGWCRATVTDGTTGGSGVVDF